MTMANWCKESNVSALYWSIVVAALTKNHIKLCCQRLTLLRVNIDNYLFYTVQKKIGNIGMV